MRMARISLSNPVLYHAVNSVQVFLAGRVPMALKQLKQKSRNQTFQWLETLAIIMVIDDHVGNRIGILSSIFPYDLFFMPMLVFVSGYFFKERSIWGGATQGIPSVFSLRDLVSCW